MQKTRVLALELKPQVSVAEELLFAKDDRLAGYVGRVADKAVDDTERIIEKTAMDI